MAELQNFRSAFNGFNREDVVHYLEYLNTKHQNQVAQLNQELEELRARLEEQTAAPAEDPAQEELEELRRQLAQAQEEKAALEERCAQLETPREEPQEQPEELETYRQAARIRQEAQDQAELVYYQANGVLTEATAKVEGASGELTDMADQVMRQLTQLQVAVSGSKQALQDAAALMNAIRPNR